MPTQFVAGNKVTSLNLSNNNIRVIPTDFQNQSFPTLKSLYVLLLSILLCPRKQLFIHLFDFHL